MDGVAQTVHQTDQKAKVFVCYYLADGTALREAWKTLKDHNQMTARLYPEHKWFSLQEAQFAGVCAQILAAGEEEVKHCMDALAPLDTEEAALREDLCRTLAVYLLDARASTAITAERMFLHRNTIKYRMHKISEDLGYRPDEMPEVRAIYLAIALKRLLEA